MIFLSIILCRIQQQQQPKTSSSNPNSSATNSQTTDENERVPCDLIAHHKVKIFIQRSREFICLYIYYTTIEVKPRDESEHEEKKNETLNGRYAHRNLYVYSQWPSDTHLTISLSVCVMFFLFSLFCFIY